MHKRDICSFLVSANIPIDVRGYSSYYELVWDRFSLLELLENLLFSVSFYQMQQNLVPFANCVKPQVQIEPMLQGF